MKSVCMTVFLASVVFLSSCQQQASEQAEAQPEPAVANTAEVEAIFPQGQKGSEEYFTGNAYNYGLVSNDSVYTMLSGNVYFEPGARSNWHSHPAGQIQIGRAHV